MKLVGFTRVVATGAVVAAVVTALVPVTTPGRSRSACSTVTPPAVDLPVDVSIREIFGIRRFISRAEWDAVGDRVLRGEVAVARNEDQEGEAVFFMQDGRNAARSPMLVKVVGRGLDASIRSEPRRGTWLVDYCGAGPSTASSTMAMRGSTDHTASSSSTIADSATEGPASS